MAIDDIYAHFHLSLCMVVSRKSDEFNELLNPLIGKDRKDRWVLRNSKVPFSSKKVYLSMTPSEKAPAPYIWIWRSCVQPKHKFLLIIDSSRKNTMKTFHVESINYVLFQENGNECLLHLLFRCDFSQIFCGDLVLNGIFN
jgi:hypothetical protein